MKSVGIDIELVRLSVVDSASIANLGSGKIDYLHEQPRPGMTDDPEFSQCEAASRQSYADIQAELKEQCRDDEVGVGKVFTIVV